MPGVNTECHELRNIIVIIIIIIINFIIIFQLSSAVRF